MFSPTSSVFGQYFHSDQPAAAAVATSTASAVTQSASTTASVSPLNPDRVRVRAKGLRGEYSLDWAVEVFQPVLQSHGLAPTEENIAPGSRYSTLETKSKRWKNTCMVDFYISRQLYNALPMPNGEYLWHDGQGMCLLAKRLEKGCFIWPQTIDQSGDPVAITPAQLGYLLEGIDWRAPRRSFVPQAAG